MHQFVQSLENRRLLSAAPTTVALDEARVLADLKNIAVDAKSAKATLTTDVKAVAGDLKALNLQNDPLKTTLDRDLTAHKKTITADVKRIISAGSDTARAIVTDWLNINVLHAGNPAIVAKDQTKLVADVTKLRDIESPLFARLQTDINSAETQVEADVQAIANKYSSDATLQTDWSALQGAIQTSQQTITTDFGNLAIDVNSLVNDA